MKKIAFLISGNIRIYEKNLVFFEEIKKILKDYEIIIVSSIWENQEDLENFKEKYKIKIISALTITNKEDVDRYKDYLEVSDIILFDSKGYHKSESFDHNLLEQVPTKVNKMIAGNIQIDDIPNFKNKDFIIDLSGSIENNEGKKDINKIFSNGSKLPSIEKEIKNRFSIVQM